MRFCNDLIRQSLQVHTISTRLAMLENLGYLHRVFSPGWMTIPGIRELYSQGTTRPAHYD